MLDLRTLRTFTALREGGSLVAAAARLHLTQSALSHHIKALEHQFGTALYVRKSRPLRFTPAGERLLALADEVLPRVSAAEQELRQIAQGQSGRLHIAIECHSCFEWLMPAMDEYRCAWPDIEMDLSLGFSFEPLPALTMGDIDLVVTSDPQPILELDYQSLFGYQALLAMAPDHRLATRAWIEPQDLRAETLITYPVERKRLDIFTRFLDPAGIEPAAVRTSELTVMMMQLVASRRGVAALPNWALMEYADRGYVVARPLGESGMWGTLYAATRAEDARLAYMRDFLRIARHRSYTTLKGIFKPA
ncbi:MAG TPA: LysR substrate-binding domain-containing protein [Gammaproteobacteria bacterium]|jgi:LysR family transcriptional regulator for metE and metH|nr:LysR substrate-binding domain-containing protein [Gammaproteobacteria bacterium]